MAQYHIEYQGQLRTKITHQGNGQSIITDAPVDNHGKGEFFSPTDLMASSLGSCILTIMGIHANMLGVDLKGSNATVEKIMQDSPRKIQKIRVNIHLPLIDKKLQERLEKVALECPVHHSFHTETGQEIVFHWEIGRAHV